MSLLLSTGKDGYVPDADFERRTAGTLKDAAEGKLLDASTEGYAYDVVDTVGYEKKFAKFKEYLPDGPRSYLEIGCGYGRWAPILFKEDPQIVGYVGVDACYARIKHAMYLHEREDRARFSWMNAASVTPAGVGCRFDVVFICTVIQHLRLDEKSRLMDFATRHVKDSGSIIIFEGKVLDEGIGGCEKHYKDDKCPAHMIPTPYTMLRIWAKPFILKRIGAEHFVARKEEKWMGLE
jgi:SAM-dependent methyltransferase